MTTSGIVCLNDLEFEKVPVECRTTSGLPYVRWIRVGMPSIPPHVIHSVFYLYRTVEDAEAGKDPGGTGFIVSFLGHLHRGGDPVPMFGVTNWHVACSSGYSVIRLNKRDGGIDVLEFGPEDWEFLPGKYDVAVVPLTLHGEVHAFASISTHSFVESPRGWGRETISVGDDAFMMGLFVDHDGLTTNIPSARFGNVSMLPSKKATVQQPTGYMGESYIVDMHSRTGFSGSPVFAYRTFGSDLSNLFGESVGEIELHQVEADRHNRIKARNGRIKVNTMFKFLGIYWGQFPEMWELKNKSQLQESRKNHLVMDGGYVEGMSGMTCVIPAWEIMEVLEMASLKGKQKRPSASGSALAPRPEAVSPPAADANPNHREDFTSLLNAAARKPESKD